MTDLAPLVPLAAALVAECTRRKFKVTTAESCTGGLVAVALTEIPGSSVVLDRAFVTYSDGAKSDMLGVPASLIQANGAVSEAVARAMAEGAVAHSAADLAVAVTGIAGPEGGTPDKPVGLVHFAILRRGGPTRHIARRFPDNGRPSIRLAAAAEALKLLHALATGQATTP